MRLPRPHRSRVPLCPPSFSAGLPCAFAKVPSRVTALAVVLSSLLPGAGWGAEGPRARVTSEGAGGFTLRITLSEPRTHEVVIDGARYLSVQIPGFAPGSDALGSPTFLQFLHPRGAPHRPGNS
jgi:hypothetical protein